MSRLGQGARKRPLPTPREGDARAYPLRSVRDARGFVSIGQGTRKRAIAPTCD